MRSRNTEPESHESSCGAPARGVGTTARRPHLHLNWPPDVKSQVSPYGRRYRLQQVECRHEAERLQSMHQTHEIPASVSGNTV